MSSISPLTLIILMPLLASGLVLLLRNSPNLREGASLIVGVSLFACVLSLAMSGETLETTWVELLPGLSLSFAVQPLGMLFALVASALWPVTTLYAIGYMRAHEEDNQTRFYCFFAIAIAAVMGIAFSDNLFTLFVFYEIITFSTYPLVTHAGTEKARAGGRTYLSLLLGTSVMFFIPALIGTWYFAGSLDFQAGGVFQHPVSDTILSILLVLFVFGIGKAAVMPFHRWLPAAMVAPTPVSALLHAVAVVKAGVFSLLKVCAFIFGADTLQSLPVTEYLLYLVGFGILMASWVAMRQDNLKKRLAYSTVSQLGYISLGALLATSDAFTGSAMHIVMHAAGKITLFFCAGAILVAVHKSEVSQLRGLGRQMPWTMTAFFIGTLSIIGLPPTGGLWSKWFLLLGALDAGYWILLVTLMISSILNIVYLLPIAIRAFFPGGPLPEGHRQEAPIPSLIAIGITSAACVALFFWPQVILDLLPALSSGSKG